MSDEFDGLPSIVLAPNRINVCQEQGLNILRCISMWEPPGLKLYERKEVICFNRRVAGLLSGYIVKAEIASGGYSEDVPFAVKPAHTSHYLEYR